MDSKLHRVSPAPTTEREGLSFLIEVYGFGVEKLSWVKGRGWLGFRGYVGSRSFMLSLRP